MAGIKTLPRRPSLPAVSAPSVRAKKGTTTASKPRPLTHLEARAKQLAEKAVEVATRAAKGNGKTGSATGGYRPTPPPTEPQREFAVAQSAPVMGSMRHHALPRRARGPRRVCVWSHQLQAVLRTDRRRVVPSGVPLQRRCGEGRVRQRGRLRGKAANADALRQLRRRALRAGRRQDGDVSVRARERFVFHVARHVAAVEQRAHLRGPWHPVSEQQQHRWHVRLRLLALGVH